MSTEHTKGPWRVGGDGFMATGLDRSKIGGNTPINIVSDGGSGGWSITTHIAHLSAGDVTKRIANGRLIASAPDLLAACEKGILYDEEVRSCANDPEKMASHCTAQGDSLDDLYAAWMIAIRNAVAKALECG